MRAIWCLYMQCIMCSLHVVYIMDYAIIGTSGLVVLNWVCPLDDSLILIWLIGGSLNGTHTSPHLLRFSCKWLKPICKLIMIGSFWNPTSLDCICIRQGRKTPYRYHFSLAFAYGTQAIESTKHNIGCCLLTLNLSKLSRVLPSKSVSFTHNAQIIII